jgi:peptidylprolyl isomerase
MFTCFQPVFAQDGHMSNSKSFLALCALSLLQPVAASVAASKATMAELLAESRPGDWRSLDPENTLYLELASGRVVIDLAPDLAPHHVANVKALAREHYYDGLAITRAQDNYVVQMGDPNADKPELARKVQNGQRTLPPEFERDWNPKLPFTRLPDGDVYAPQAGFSGGLRVARDPRTGKAWLVHEYRMRGLGRDDAPNTGGRH